MQIRHLVPFVRGTTPLVERRGEQADMLMDFGIRTVSDDTDMKDSFLVLGEVVGVPGKWSSYPPRHHPQITAPGYAMWYLWGIRHLDNNRYGTPTFTEEHRWVTQLNAPIWSPKKRRIEPVGGKRSWLPYV